MSMNSAIDQQRLTLVLSGRDHYTDVNGDCIPGCVACEIEKLRKENAELRELVCRIAEDVLEDTASAKWGR